MRIEKQTPISHLAFSDDNLLMLHTWPSTRGPPSTVARAAIVIEFLIMSNPNYDLFDANWYLKFNPDVASSNLHPVVHYVRHGSSEGRRPNPFFAPSWYRQQNPDVVRADVEPLAHFEAHGWQEGRDPSPAFSTRFYLDANPDVAQSKINPLDHYLKFGLAEGRSPRHDLGAVNLVAPHVAIIVLDQASPEKLITMLISAAQSLSVTPFTIFLSPMGRLGPQSQSERLHETIIHLGLRVKWTDPGQGLTSVERANLAIENCLNDSFTHVALLGTGILTPRWLDRLLDTCEPVVAPVTVGSSLSQDVPILNTSENGSQLKLLFEASNARFESWSSASYQYDVSELATLVVRSDIIKNFSVLDNRFESPYTAVCDYSVRLAKSGHPCAVMRNVLIESWSADGVHQEKNLHPLGTKQERERLGRLLGLVGSQVQDMASLCALPGRSPFLAVQRRAMEQHGLRILDAVRALISALEGGVGDHDETAQATLTTMSNYSADPLLGMSEIQRYEYFLILNSFIQEISKVGFFSIDGLLCAALLFRTLARECAERNSTLVFCNSSPAAFTGRDGYERRVLAVDSLFDCLRIYVEFDASRARPSLTRVDSETLHITLRDDDPLSEALLGTIAARSKIYVHSVYPLLHRTALSIVRKHPQSTLLDMHGAVPEEQALMGFPTEARRTAEVERIGCGAAAMIICVSDAMSRHFKSKYGEAVAHKLVVCPIFREPALPARVGTAQPDVQVRSDGRLRVVYAGGVQPWQQMPKMLDIVVHLHDQVEFTMFVADAGDAVLNELIQRGIEPELARSIVRTAQHDELLACLPDYDLGFVLRDSSIVNAVCCPTKLIEYVEAGVVPIFDSPNIGDFVANGIGFVALSDISGSGPLPDRKKIAAIARRNEEILVRMNGSYGGPGKIVEWLQSDVAGRSEKDVQSRDQRPCIGLVVENFDKGGLEQVVLNLYEGFRSAGFRCVIFVQYSVGALGAQITDPQDIVFVRNDKRLFLSRAISSNVSILSYHYSTFCLDEAISIGIKTVYTVHNLYPWLDDHAFSERATMVKKASSIVAVSANVRSYFCDRAFLPYDRVDVIENGISPAFFLSSAEIGHGSFREGLGLSADAFVFAHVASFHRCKHQALSIAAAERLARELPDRDFMLLFVGNASDLEYRLEIDDQIARSSARDRIRVIDYVDSSKMAEFYRQVADAVLLPSIHEGCSNVVLEAMASGKPAIVTDVGAAREAERLWSGIRIVSRAYGDPLLLTRSEIERLSRMNDTPNLDDLVVAMHAVLDEPRLRRQPTSSLLNVISADAMVARHLAVAFRN